MTFNETDAVPPFRPDGRRGALLAPIALGAVTFVLAAACTSSHKAATATSSAPSSSLSSGLSSGPVAPLSSGPVSVSPIAPVSPSAVVSLPTPVSSEVAPGPPVANIEAPATKAGFPIRVHRGQLLKVDLPQAKAGAKLSWAFSPTSSTSLKPLPGYGGYYIGNVDGVVTVQVSQDGLPAGTLTVTVWG